MRATVFLLFLASFAYGQNREPATPQYYPDNWTWTDSDGDCLDTRAEVLVERSHKEVTISNCTVMTGEWVDYYTGFTFTQAEEVAVDHVVPLRHAFETRAVVWPSLLKQIFANDPDNLLITGVEVSSQRNSRPPQFWTPPRSEFICEYLEKWQAIKYKYRLQQSQEEFQFLADHQCQQNGVVALPPTNGETVLTPTSEIACSEETYRVIKGDTFYSLSKRFSVSVEQLQEMVGSDILREHQVLSIGNEPGSCR
jgi:hypothetical protein